MKNNLSPNLSSENFENEPAVGIVPHKSLFDTSLPKKKNQIN